MPTVNLQGCLRYVCGLGFERKPDCDHLRGPMRALEREGRLTTAKRARLAEILCNQSADLTEEEAYRRRIEAIDLMVALCDKRETVKRDRIRLRTKVNPPVKSESPEPEAKFEPNPDPFPLLMQATQCPDCVGDTRLTLEERAFTYCRPTVMNDHFDDQHLVRREQAEQSGETIRCEHPKCRDVILQHLDHFRSHVQRVHGVTLRTSSQVKQRRQRKILTISLCNSDVIRWLSAENTTDITK
ncbi:hypothetical protein AUP68_06371 [Ilyonectria robusta]